MLHVSPRTIQHMYLKYEFCLRFNFIIKARVGVFVSKHTKHASHLPAQSTWNIKYVTRNADSIHSDIRWWSNSSCEYSGSGTFQLPPLPSPYINYYLIYIIINAKPKWEIKIEHCKRGVHSEIGACNWIEAR